MMKYVFSLLIYIICNSAIANDCVVLLHGMARTDRSMNKMATELQKENYTVVNFKYPSTKYAIEQIAKEYIPQAIKKCQSASRISFVTHSLGGIVLRQFLKDNELKELYRVVMLGPPNKGSNVVDKLRKVPGFKFINGPAGMQLGTEDSSLPNVLGPVNYPVGIIAGTSTFNPILSLMLPNPDDGKVSVNSTKLEGMTDHITIAASHPFLMKNDDVIKQVKAFLNVGKFIHTEAKP